MKIKPVQPGFAGLGIIREAHRGFTGMAIFCKGCQSILDCKDSVAIDIRQDDTNRLIYNLMVCSSCYERVVKPNLEGINETICYAEITDGRRIYSDDAFNKAIEKGGSL